MTSAPCGESRVRSVRRRPAASISASDFERNSSSDPLTVSAVHRAKHVAHRLLDAREDRAGNNRVSDIEFDQMRNREDGTDVLVVDAMARIHAEAERMSQLGAFDQAAQFRGLLLAGCIGKGARVQLDELGL